MVRETRTLQMRDRKILIPAFRNALTLRLTALHERDRIATGVISGSVGGAAGVLPVEDVPAMPGRVPRRREPPAGCCTAMSDVSQEAFEGR